MKNVISVLVILLDLYARIEGSRCYECPVNCTNPFDKNRETVKDCPSGVCITNAAYKSNSKEECASRTHTAYKTFQQKDPEVDTEVSNGFSCTCKGDLCNDDATFTANHSNCITMSFLTLFGAVVFLLFEPYYFV